MTLKERIIFIGLGQCGGNIAVEAINAGYNAGAINTSSEDINTENMRVIANKKIIGNTEGCGKERKLAQKIVKEEYQSIVDFIGESFLRDTAKQKQKKIVYLCFSSSGGTGSGVGPILINILKKVYPEVIFGAIVTNPSSDESLIAIYNSKKCLEELYNLSIPIFLADNNNTEKKSSRKLLYESVNKEIIDSIDIVVKDRSPSSIANMDEKDKIKLLSTPGVIVIARTPLVDNELTDKNTLASAIESSWTNNIFVKVEFDKVIKRVGYLFDIPENVSGKIDYKLIHKNLGVPTEVFEGIYPIVDSKKEISVVTSILTGVSFPSNKVDELNKLLEEFNENSSGIERNKDLFSKKSSFNDNVFFDEEPTSKSSKAMFDFNSSEEDDNDEIDIESILNSY